MTDFNAKIDTQNIKSILLWMPNWIGDAVLALPSVSALRERYPSARITAAVREPADELLRGINLFDTIIRIPNPRKEGMLRQIRFTRKLKKYQYDISAVFPNSFRSAFLLSQTGAPIRIGYDIGIRYLFLTHPIQTNATDTRAQNRIDYFFNVLAPFGLDKPRSEGISVETLPEDPPTDEVLKSIGIEPDEFFIMVHPGASKQERSWRHERFAILSQKLIKQYDFKIVLLGSKKEMPMLEKIKKFAPAGKIQILPELNLRGVAKALKKTGLFIGNDSGMMHLSALMNTPVLGIFGPGSAKTTGPHIAPEKKEIVSLNFPCSPCRQNFFKECKPSAEHKPYCLDDITVKDVSDAADRILSRIRK
ncbi:MAG: lipopolysaccharide heptosyltransferase II [Nitrospinae bacterium CG11_big_fil_rev_8_21_14_0_20_45_15]|nr:MAG: lipopolysaccharide heptosyltransferase II [Nitrospinae bacterium CG11_big_fil_rev_8_21_14_0_20_45_15]